jgi:hypothetical protein
MAIRNDFAPGEVLAAADLNDTFGSKLPIAGGKILQIVRATDTTNRTTTSTSFVDITGMSVTITPQKSDSAILLFLGVCYDVKTTAAAPLARFQITDSSNNALSGAEGSPVGLFAGGNDESYAYDIFWGYSTPATTSATTYKARFTVSGAGVTVVVRNADCTGQLYAIEVSA